jgi:phosphoglycerate kinase
LQAGQILLLENIRFSAAETSKEETERAAFAADLAKLADFYVGDGFGAVHRKHASVFDLPKLLPHAAGKLVAAEVEVLKKLTQNPERPYGVILGGAKVSDKLGVIENLLGKVDVLAIGGGMVFTFLKAQGKEIGTSLVEAEMLDVVTGLIATAEKNGVKLLLPTDIVVAPAFSADAQPTLVAADAIPADQMGLDIGPVSAAAFASAATACRQISRASRVSATSTASRCSALAISLARLTAAAAASFSASAAASASVAGAALADAALADAALADAALADAALADTALADAALAGAALADAAWKMDPAARTSGSPYCVESLIPLRWCTFTSWVAARLSGGSIIRKTRSKERGGHISRI